MNPIVLLLAAGGMLAVGGKKRRRSAPEPRPSEENNLSPFAVGQRWPGKREWDYSQKAVRHSERSELVRNISPLIVFKDEEGTGVDRYMTERMAIAVNRLAGLVHAEWPKTKLRVTEAFDEEDEHTSGSTHYEGRGADLTVTPRDLSKLGMVASLATISGFDWVYYEDESHIHVSVAI